MTTSRDAEIEALLREFARLRAEMERERRAHDAAQTAMFDECADRLMGCVEAAVGRMETVFWDALERRFAELSARLDAELSARLDGDPRSPPGRLN